jgi:hypothetical protein
MFTNRRRFTTPLLAALMLVALALVVSACGSSSDEHEVAEGEIVKIGGLKYSVVFSRYLNPNDNEDAAYLKGLPPAKNGYNYFGVFLQVKNPTHETLTLVNELTVTDSDGQKFDSVENESEFAFQFGAPITENEWQPELDTTASSGPIQGSVVIFEMPEEVSANRPLLLHIPGPPKESGIVVLDL